MSTAESLAVPRHLQRNVLGALLAIALLILALACFAPAAHAAEYEEYLCYSCSQVSGYGHIDSPSTGQTHWEVSGTNKSGKGVCAVFWENLPENKYKEYPACTSSGTEDYITIFHETWGHGQTRRWYKEYLYNLFGDVYY